MIIYDSCYSILLDIITNLGGDNRKWDSVYSQTLYIAGLLGVDTQGKRYDSVYSILLDIIAAMGGDNTRYFDSVYSELKYVAELSGCEEKYYDSNYSILLDIVGGSPVYDYDGLTFEALEDGCAVAMNNYGTNATTTKPDLQYTFGDDIWKVWNGEEITLNYGEKIGFKATRISTSTANYSKFVMTGRIAASGNMMSLVDDGECTASTIPANYYFYYLFNPCPSLVNVDNLTLPATTLKANCYNRMFFGCGFEKAPEILPATALTEGCYYMMFQGCLNLKESPILPAETLVKTCYYQMFNACSSLEKITALFLTTPGTTTSTNQTRNWVSGVPSGATSGGVFVKNVKAFWGVDGVNGIPSGWQTIYKDTTDNTYWLEQSKTTQCDKYGNPI